MRKLEDLELITKAAVHLKGKWPDGYKALIVSTKKNNHWGGGHFQSTNFDKVNFVKTVQGRNAWKWVCTREEFEEYMKTLSDNAPEVATHYLPKDDDYYTKKDGKYHPVTKQAGIHYYVNLFDHMYDSLIPLPEPKPTPWTPEIGQSCQVLWYNNWHETFIVGKDSDGDFVYEITNFSEIVSFAIADSTTQFRPIPTENEVDPVSDEECPYFRIRNLGDQLHNILCELQDEPIADQLENVVHELWKIMKPSPEDVETRNKLYDAVSSLGVDLNDIQINKMINFIIECKEKPQTSKPVG